MKAQRLTGPGVGVEKYDLITALAVKALAEGGQVQASLLRLIALITSRYNWAGDEVSIGQREMAALWSVDERTAKRETRRLIDANLLTIKRPGVRGRVATYRLLRDEIYKQTAICWGNVGPDYDARMNSRHVEPSQQAEQRVIKIDFMPREKLAPVTPWQRSLARLEVEQPELYSAWFSQLNAEGPNEEDILDIQAPSRFIAGYVMSHHLPMIEHAVSVGYGRKLRCSVFA